MRRLIRAIDARDVLAIVGLVLIGYGLWLFIPAVAFVVVGVLVLVGAFQMRR